MFHSRFPTGLERKKPNLPLSRDIIDIDSFELGDEGELDAAVDIISVELRMDETENERRHYNIKVVSAEKLTQRKARL
jgi:hypothetical protein